MRLVLRILGLLVRGEYVSACSVHFWSINQVYIENEPTTWKHYPNTLMDLCLWFWIGGNLLFLRLLTLLRLDRQYFLDSISSQDLLINIAWWNLNKSTWELWNSPFIQWNEQGPECLREIQLKLNEIKRIWLINILTDIYFTSEIDGRRYPFQGFFRDLKRRNNE